MQPHASLRSIWRKILRGCERMKCSIDADENDDYRRSLVSAGGCACTAIYVMYASCPLMRLHLCGPRWQYIRCAITWFKLRPSLQTDGALAAKSCFSSVSITTSLSRAFWCANPVAGRAFQCVLCDWRDVASCCWREIYADLTCDCETHALVICSGQSYVWMDTGFCVLLRGP